MKKSLVILSAICLLSTTAIAADTTQKTNEGIKNPTNEELIQAKKNRDKAFEQKLGLTEEQIAKAKELRVKGHEQMKPVMEKLIKKKKEAEMVKLSRMAALAQEEKLTVLDKEIAELEKQANTIRKKNMKDFEAILTKDQKKILNQMKQEGRQKFEQRNKPCPPPPCPENTESPEISK